MTNDHFIKSKELIQKGLKGYEQKGRGLDGRKGKENPRETQELEIRLRALTRTNANFQNEIAELNREAQIESRKHSRQPSSTEFQATIQGMVDKTLAINNRLTKDILQISEM